MTRAVLIGVCCSILGAFPLAALTALVYSFPVPFRGKVSGPEGVISSQGAVFLYGITGGFVVLGLVGVAAGVIASWAGRDDPRRVAWLSVLLSLLFSAACVILLATLELIIGPW